MTGKKGTVKSFQVVIFSTVWADNLFSMTEWKRVFNEMPGSSPKGLLVWESPLCVVIATDE